MYIEGSLTVDPSQVTEIARQKPTKAFGRIASLLTVGLADEKQEVETFSALSILQRIFRVLRSVGVDDVIRISKDDTVFFEDEENRTDDLREALEQFAQSIQANGQQVFEKLTLVLKHQFREMDFLIDVTILRRHRVGEFPIRLVINGMPTALNALNNIDDIRTQLSPHFESQADYDRLIEENMATFDAYLDTLKAAFEAKMQVDQVVTQRALKVLRPSKRVENRRSHDDYYDDDDLAPVHRSCCHHDDSFLFAWLWADHCQSHGIRCRDLTIVDERGQDIADIGSLGFYAGVEPTLDTEQPFALPSTGVETVYQGHEYQSETKHSAEGLDTDSASSDAGIAEVDSTKGGWLSSIGDWAGDTFSGDHGGSSCSSSCGGCGGD